MNFPTSKSYSLQYAGTCTFSWKNKIVYKYGIDNNRLKLFLFLLFEKYKEGLIKFWNDSLFREQRVPHNSFIFQNISMQPCTIKIWQQKFVSFFFENPVTCDFLTLGSSKLWKKKIEERFYYSNNENFGNVLVTSNSQAKQRGLVVQDRGVVIIKFFFEKSNLIYW